MALKLIIEQSPHAQDRSETLHVAGELSIGRGDEADWRIDDPDMYVSRLHCIVSGDAEGYRVTDSSRGGLFVDGAETPLGPGQSAVLEHGMRLRMGDVVLRVELDTAAPEKADAAGARPKAPHSGTLTFGNDDFFARRTDQPAPTPRPGTLPEPFETARSASNGRVTAPPNTPAPPPLFDDPFTLDPPSSRPVDPVAGQPEAATTHDRHDTPDDVFGAGDETTATPERASLDRTDTTVHTPPPLAADRRPPQPVQAPPDHAGPEQGAVAAPADELLASLYRGLGLPVPPTDPSPDELEQIGRDLRHMTEGVIQLLRARAREKQNVRVAQTVIGSQNVNPLKFLATTDEALGALITPRGKGYLPPDEAIAATFRDLADHQIRNWTAMQAALRRMIDRFDPETFETEVDTEGRLTALLAGGRGARLWQLYTERYREIASAAEDRFLGEVGADFRDAYEGNRRTDHD